MIVDTCIFIKSVLKLWDRLVYIKNDISTGMNERHPSLSSTLNDTYEYIEKLPLNSDGNMDGDPEQSQGRCIRGRRSYKAKGLIKLLRIQATHLYSQ